MKNWTIGKRIVAGFAALLAASAALGVFAYVRLIAVSVQTHRITVDCLPGVYDVGQIDAINQANFTLTHRWLLISTAEDRAAIEAEMKANSKRLTELYAHYETSIVLPEDRALFDAVLAARGPYTDIRKTVLADPRPEARDRQIDLLVHRLDPAYQAYRKAIRDLVDFNKTNGDDAGAKIVHAVRSAETGIVTGLIVALVLGLGVSLYIITDVNRTLRQIAAVLQGGSAQVATAADQVADTSQQLAQGASQQAASLEETSASLEEITAMTKRNAEHADSAKQLSGETRRAADAGAADTAAMSRAMDAIKASSGNIGKIIKTIDEIAFQTNILALNAAVEAARAGEAGLGFAVVAEEVRNLAQRCAQAARETAERIEESIGTGEKGVAISVKVAATLQEILAKARGVDDLVAEIASSSTQQSQGIGQIGSAVIQMDRVTQTTAATAEEGAGAAEELNAQASAMKTAADRLRRLVDGGARASDVSEAAREPAEPPIHAVRRAQALRQPVLTH